MELQQILPLLAQLEPARRRAFAASVGIPEHALAQLEAIAVEKLGLELVGGPSGAGEEEEGGAEAEAGEEDDARPSLAVVRGVVARARGVVRCAGVVRATYARGGRHGASCGGVLRSTAACFDCAAMLRRCDAAVRPATRRHG